MVFKNRFKANFAVSVAKTILTASSSRSRASSMLFCIVFRTYRFLEAQQKNTERILLDTLGVFVSLSSTNVMRVLSLVLNRR